MKVTELLETLIKKEGKKKAEIYRNLHITVGAFNGSMASGNPKLDNLIDIAGQLGYDVCLMKHREAGRLPDGLYVIERGDSVRKNKAVKSE